MPRSVIALRVLYWVLMAIFLLLIITSSISGYGTVLYAVVVMGVIAWERWLSRRKVSA